MASEWRNASRRLATEFISLQTKVIGISVADWVITRDLGSSWETHYPMNKGFKVKGEKRESIVIIQDCLILDRTFGWQLSLAIFFPSFCQMKPKFLRKIHNITKTLKSWKFLIESLHQIISAHILFLANRYTTALGNNDWPLQKLGEQDC